MTASAESLTILAFILPLVVGVLIPLFGEAQRNLREAVTLVGALATFALVLGLISAVADGARPEIVLVSVQPDIALAFSVEPLGMVFAAVASGLWIVNSVYSIGYMRGHDEPRQTGFYVCFAIAIVSALGIAFSANLVTLFLFYEILTISTYPLVTHKQDEKARRGGRIYLLLLLGTSMVLLLPAIVWTQVAAGTTAFTPGGVLAGKLSSFELGVLLALFAFGIGKAALMPLHGWLPNAMVAPTPVSALLHAVAVVKAGVFTLLKLVVFIFGPATLGADGVGDWLVYLAGAAIVVASLIAMTKDNLKARLAYSTVGQLSYIILGAALASGAGLLGGALHIVTHAFGKITLFMCAGAIYVATGKTEISDMRGLGRAMPFTFAAFGIAALSLIGVPPLGGSWSKWLLAVGSAEAGHTFLIAAVMISSLLNVAYLLPIVVQGFYRFPGSSSVPSSGSGPGSGTPAKDGPPEASTGNDGGLLAGVREAPLFCVIPLVFTALGCVALFFFSGDVVAFLEPSLAPAKEVGNGE
ncbi:MAG: proton-conducting transporter membrane subunit [Pseudomonadota bacterium]